MPQCLAGLILVSFAGSSLVIAGCATSGQAWIRAPDDALSVNASSEVATTIESDTPLQVSGSVRDEGTEPNEAPRHRLDHVVSLGEGPSSERSDAVASPSNSAPTVVVNITNTTAPAYGASYGYGYLPSYEHGPSYRGSRGANAEVTRVVPTRGGATRTGGAPPIGHDFPAPPSYGPNFPYSASPASSWGRLR